MQVLVIALLVIIALAVGGLGVVATIGMFLFVIVFPIIAAPILFIHNYFYEIILLLGGGMVLIGGSVLFFSRRRKDLDDGSIDSINKQTLRDLDPDQ